MVLGEEFSTGGKPLESDILAKRIDFFKTQGEHIRDIGTEIILDNSLVNPNTTVTVYTVSENVIAFVHYLSHSISSVASGFTSNRSTIFLGQSLKPISILSVADPEAANSDIIFIPMLRLDVGRQIVLSQTNSTVTGETRAILRGILYEIPKETPL